MNVKQALIPGLPDDVAAYSLLRVDYTKINIFASVCRRWRQELRSPDFLRRRRVAGVTQSILAFILIDKTPDIYGHANYIALLDPKSGQWRRVPPIPIAASFYAEKHNLVQAGHRMVAVSTSIIYGFVPTVYVYDLLANIWRKGAPNPIRNGRIPACASDGVRHVFVAGGTRKAASTAEPVSTAELYDVDTDTWHMLPDMATTRVTCHGYFHAGIFYVYSSHLTTAQRYDVSTGHWRSIPEFAPLKTFHSKNGWAGFLAADGNYYRFNADGTKLTVKRGASWDLVGNLPPILCESSLLIRMAWKGGFVMANKLRNRKNVVYMLPLIGDHNQNISYTEAIMPKEYEGVIISGCCLEV